MKNPPPARRSSVKPGKPRGSKPCPALSSVSPPAGAAPRVIRGDARLFPSGRPWHAAAVRLARRDRFTPHTHAGFAELIWVREGVLQHELKPGTVLLPAGTLTLVRERDVHGLGAGLEGAVEWVNLAFPLRQLRKIGLWEAAATGPVRSLFAAPAPPVVRLAEPQRREADRLVSELLEKQAGAWGGLLFHRTMTWLLAALVVAEPLTPAAGEPPDWLARVLADLVRDDAGPLPDTRELARRCGRVPAHVSRAFRRHLGVTPTGYLNRLRLDRAARLLLQGHRKVLGACLGAGFRNVAHFYRLFRREYGMTPLAWQKRRAGRPPV